MEIEWDGKKVISNLKKHGIDFADAVSVLEDERAITIGKDFFNRILVVVYTWRGPRIRIISARKATTKEIKQYKG
jgi:uncharacterized DUF497 family protein